MSDYAVSADFCPTKVGDRWNGATVGPVTVNGSSPDNALTRVKITFRLGQTTFTLDSDDDEITITDAATWEATIPASDSFLTRAGTWKYDMEFYQSGYDSPWTLYRGEMVVYDDVT